MTIYRADPPEVETLDIELPKKPGKNLGIGFFTSNPRGMLVTDIVRNTFAPRAKHTLNSNFIYLFSKNNFMSNNYFLFILCIILILGSRRHRRPRRSHTKK